MLLHTPPHRSRQAVRWSWEQQPLGRTQQRAQCPRRGWPLLSWVCRGNIHTSCKPCKQHQKQTPDTGLVGCRLCRSGRLSARCWCTSESPAASALPGLVPTEMEPSARAAGGLGCISPGFLYLGATGITPGPTPTGLCRHPVQATGRGQGTALPWAADPSLGWPTQHPWGSFAEAGQPGLPPRQEAWPSRSSAEVPGAWQVSLAPWPCPRGAAWLHSGCPTAGREVKDPLGERAWVLPGSNRAGGAGASSECR